jgi:EAL and modified HD-GYP domain-containing signal transduction protein
MLKQKKLSPTKQNILDLITEASKEKIDLDIINNIFTKDIGLSYKLLRFINSPGYGCAQEITSLKHALIYIGDLELKKFIALLALANLNESKPDEIIRISLVRAKFCELVSNIKQDAANPPKAFLTGMLSLIDGMLDFDLELLLTLLPIHADIKMALLGKEHYLTRYLALSIAIEIGDWSRAHELCELIGVELDEICESYQEAVFWADNMLLGTI